MTKKVLILIAPGVEEIEALFPRDLFIRAGLEVDLMSISEEELILSSHKLEIRVKSFNNDFSSYSALMIPGGKAGTNNIDSFKHIDEILNYFHNENKLIAAICAAPSILGKRGYLKDHRYTCYPGWQNDEYGFYTGEPVEISEDIITGKSVYYSSDFALAIINHLLGKETYIKIANQIKGM